MLKQEDRKRIEYVKNGENSLRKLYVHVCKNCGKEMYKTATDEKKHSGYCLKCVQKFKKYEGSLRNKDGEKLCKYCKRYLPLNKFWKSNEYKKNICLKCNNLISFGITSIEYELLLKKQNNLCAICKQPEMTFDKLKGATRDLAVDHCHNTGKIRGLLCGKCNKGLGLFKDNIELLEQAIQYLKL